MNTDIHETMEAMQNLGGGFASRLADCWFHADDDNRVRIEKAWPELIEKYRAMLDEALKGRVPA